MALRTDMACSGGGLPEQIVDGAAHRGGLRGIDGVRGGWEELRRGVRERPGRGSPAHSCRVREKGWGGMGQGGGGWGRGGGGGGRRGRAHSRDPDLDPDPVMGSPAHSRSTVLQGCASPR